MIELDLEKATENELIELLKRDDELLAEYRKTIQIYKQIMGAQEEVIEQLKTLVSLLEKK